MDRPWWPLHQVVFSLFPLPLSITSARTGRSASPQPWGTLPTSWNSKSWFCSQCWRTQLWAPLVRGSVFKAASKPQWISYQHQTWLKEGRGCQCPAQGMSRGDRALGTCRSGGSIATTGTPCAHLPDPWAQRHPATRHSLCHSPTSPSPCELLQLNPPLFFPCFVPQTLKAEKGGGWLRVLVFLQWFPAHLPLTYILAAQPSDTSQIICIKQTHGCVAVSRGAPSKSQDLWLHPNHQCHGQDGTDSPSWLLQLLWEKTETLRMSKRPCHKEKGHKLSNKKEKTKQPQTKESKGLTVAEVTHEDEGKKHFPLSWRKSAQKRLQDSVAPWLHTLCPGVFCLFFSKQEVQVQALLLKILSEMVPSQMGNPKRVSGELEQSFVSRAMYDKKNPQISLLRTLRKSGWGWKHDGQDLPLLWQVSYKQRHNFSDFNFPGPEMEIVSVTDTVQ